MPWTKHDDKVPMHMEFLGRVLCGGGTPASVHRTTNPKLVKCKRCIKSMKRRNRDGDW